MALGVVDGCRRRVSGPRIPEERPLQPEVAGVVHQARAHHQQVLNGDDAPVGDVIQIQAHRVVQVEVSGVDLLQDRGGNQGAADGSPAEVVIGGQGASPVVAVALGVGATRTTDGDADSRRCLRGSDNLVDLGLVGSRHVHGAEVVVGRHGHRLRLRLRAFDAGRIHRRARQGVGMSRRHLIGEPGHHMLPGGAIAGCLLRPLNLGMGRLLERILVDLHPVEVEVVGHHRHRVSGVRQCIHGDALRSDRVDVEDRSHRGGLMADAGNPHRLGERLGDPKAQPVEQIAGRGGVEEHRLVVQRGRTAVHSGARLREPLSGSGGGQHLGGVGVVLVVLNHLLDQPLEANRDGELVVHPIGGRRCHDGEPLRCGRS